MANGSRKFASLAFAAFLLTFGFFSLGWYESVRSRSDPAPAAAAVEGAGPPVSQFKLVPQAEKVGTFPDERGVYRLDVDSGTLYIVVKYGSVSVAHVAKP
jgi:hypothetical protein